MKSLAHRPGAIAIALLFVASSMCASMGSFQSDKQKASRREEVKELMSIIRDPELRKKDPDKVTDAIQRLGELRDPAAAEDLAGLLTFRHLFPWEKDPTKPIEGNAWYFEAYPAINALLKIGRPCLPALIKVIESHAADSLETKNAMEVLIPLSRYEREKYIEEVEEAAAKASSPEAAQRLLKAAQTLKATKR